MSDEVRHEDIDTSDENQNVDGQEDMPEESQESSKKSTSNFKKLRKAFNGAMSTIKDLEREIEELKWWDDSDDDSDSGPTVLDEDVRLDIFLLKNPEAKDYESQIREIRSKYRDMSYNEALALAKTKAPVSTDKKDFDTKWAVAPKKKETKDYTPDEAVEKLSWKEYLAWARANWMKI